MTGLKSLTQNVKWDVSSVGLVRQLADDRQEVTGSLKYYRAFNQVGLVRQLTDDRVEVIDSKCKMGR